MYVFVLLENSNFSEKESNLYTSFIDTRMKNIAILVTLKCINVTDS